MSINLIVWLSVAVLAVVLMAISYIKAPPDMAYIISGLKRRTVIGGSNFRIPFLERMDKVTLELIQVDVKTSEPVPNADFINVNVDAVVNIKVGRSPEMIDRAAMNFLNARPEYISEVAKEVLEGNMREIVGQMHTKEMVLDRQKFADMVKTNADPDLARMGLEILSFNIQNFTDNDKVIENLGIDNIAQVSKGAAIARANAERDVAVARAQAEKEANDAQVAAQTEIAKKQNELEIKRAELRKDADTQNAIAEAAKGIQAEEQRKIREIRFGDANIARQEKEIELKERAVTIRERELEAEIKKQAEANRYAAEQESDAKLYAIQRDSEAALIQKQKLAEAEKFEKEREAEAMRAMSEAERVRGENEAAVIEAKGKAEAEAIRLRAVAEAEGLEKKAEAMAKYGEAAKMDLQLQVAKVYCEQLPAIAKGIAEAYSRVGSITMYGDQSGALASGVIDRTVQLSDGLSKGLGIDLKSLLAGAFGAKVLDAAARPDDR